MSMHFDPGSSTSIFVASSILLQAKLILQWTVCLKIWVWVHGEHLHLANSQADRRETIFHSQHAGAHFLTPGCTSKLFTTWLPEKSKMHFGRVTGQAKPQAKQVQTHHVWSYPIFWLPGFFWLFLFVTSHRAIFVIVDGCASDCSKVQVFYRKQWQAGGSWERNCLMRLLRGDNGCTWFRQTFTNPFDKAILYWREWGLRLRCLPPPPPTQSHYCRRVISFWTTELRIRIYYCQSIQCEDLLLASASGSSLAASRLKPAKAMSQRLGNSVTLHIWDVFIMILKNPCYTS